MEKLEAVAQVQGVIVRAQQAIAKAQSATARCRDVLEKLKSVTGQCRAEYQERRASTEESITRTEILLTVSASRREARSDRSRRVCSLAFERLPPMAPSPASFVSRKGVGERR